MAIARVVIKRLVIADQVFHSPDEDQDYVKARMYFSLKVHDTEHYEWVAVQQPRGTKFEDATFEVGPPNGTYIGNWNHDLQ